MMQNDPCEIKEPLCPVDVALHVNDSGGGLCSWSVYKSRGVVVVMLACVIVEGISQKALHCVTVVQTSLAGISIQPCMMFWSQGLLR